MYFQAQWLIFSEHFAACSGVTVATNAVQVVNINLATKFKLISNKIHEDHME